MKHLFYATVVLACSGLTVAAHATPLTIEGSYSVSYSAIDGNGPTITDTLPAVFTESLTLNDPTRLGFLSVSPASCFGSTTRWGDCEGAGTAQGTITATFAFTDPSGATGDFTDTGVYKANYNNDTDSVTWNSSNDPFKVTFADGAVADVSLNNAQDWTIDPTITFDLVTAPSSVPEPFSLPLLGIGMLGLGVARRKHLV